MTPLDKAKAIMAERIKDYNNDGEVNNIDAEIHSKIREKLQAIDHRTWSEAASDYIYDTFVDLVEKYIPVEQAENIYNYLSGISTTGGILS